MRRVNAIQSQANYKVNLGMVINKLKWQPNYLDVRICVASE